MTSAKHLPRQTAPIPKGSGGADFIALLPDHHPLNKDRIILNRQIKQKRQSKINLQLPLL
jgi:hypothetical protein